MGARRKSLKRVGNKSKINEMEIKNRQLTINQQLAENNAECIARCTVELNALETLSLANPWHPGFRLSCVLEAEDPGPNPVLYTYPRRKTFRGVIDVTQMEQMFEVVIDLDILNEDIGGPDEVRAKFTLEDRSNGRSVTRRSPVVNLSV